jgi:hypothetical protein
MKLLVSPLAAGIMLFAGGSIAYFKYQRPVQPPGEGQSYLVVDETIWRHSRSDLADLRLYAGQTEIPYALTTQRGSLERDRRAVSVLQQSSLGGKTQFLIDMSSLSPTLPFNAVYDRVDLKLTTRNFIAHARAEGADDLHGNQWANLGDSILYDLSMENLGENSSLRLPKTTFRYLRVTIDGPVQPRNVTGASSEQRQEQKPAWRDVSSQFKYGATPGAIATPEGKGPQTGKDSLLTFQVPENVPVERLVFAIDPGQPNFRREVEIEDEKGRELGSGEISSIHVERAGQSIDVEQHEVDFSTDGQKTILVIIANGDDPPLQITGARLQQYERRIYFDPPAGSGIGLYYGDEKLEHPVYDYAKLFQQDKNAVAAQLGSETANAAFRGRADDRPWSERHPAVLWIAIVGAVLVLGVLALRSMKSAAG